MQRLPTLLDAVFLLTVTLLLPTCYGASTIEHREPLTKHLLALQAKPIDPRAKLIGFNQALAERLQHTRTALRPLQTHAANLQRRFLSARAHTRSSSVDPATVRTERNGLLQDAFRLRAAVERSLLGLGALDRSYRNMRMLAGAARGSGGLPRGMLDRDTERQMELNERIYKNIIDLLVHLIECPVNIIHDMMGTSSTASSTPTSSVGGTEAPEEQPYYTTLPEEADPNTNELYDVDGTEGGDAEGVGEPWLEEFHY
uniref:Uncharacterized protein n=1 Tax=Anopheles atroparvus TaxID=41427 RepID=A0AAG5CMV7_ANOAO